MQYRSGLVPTLAGGAVVFFSYRICLHALGYERYGLWLVLSTVLNIAQMGSVGLSPALTRMVARTRHGHGDGEAERYLLTSVAIVCCTGLLLCGALAGNGARLTHLFKLDSGAAALFLRFLPWVALLSVYAVVVDLFAATLSGLGRIDLVNYSQFASQAGCAAITVALLEAGAGLAALFVGSAASLALLHGLLLFHLRSVVRLRFVRGFAFRMEDVRHLLGFGGWVAGMSVVNASVGPLTRILLARFAGLASVPAYDLAWSACFKIRSVWECPLRALLPEFSRLADASAENGCANAEITYRNAVRLIRGLATPVYAAVFLLARQVLQVWLGTTNDASVTTLRVMLAATYISLLGVPSFYLLMGVGEVWRCFAASAAMALTCLAWLTYSVRFENVLTAPLASVGFLIGTSVLTIYLSARAQKTLKSCYNHGLPTH